MCVVYCDLIYDCDETIITLMRNNGIMEFCVKSSLTDYYRTIKCYYPVFFRIRKNQTDLLYTFYSIKIMSKCKSLNY